MEYLSDHARIVILEKKLQQLTRHFVAYIANSGRTSDCVGQVVEVIPVTPEKILETLITPHSEQVWKNQETQITIQPSDNTQTVCPVHNSLRNSNELSYK